MNETSSNSSQVWANIRSDLPASLVVFLVALPLCMGVAIASGVPVVSGLVAGMVGGLVVGLLAGSPLQVSGPAAGLTVIVYEFVRHEGLEKLGPMVLLAGLLQLLAGGMKLGQWFRAVSPSVIKGMLAGIGVLILGSQFHVMFDAGPRQNGLKNLIAIPESVATVVPFRPLEPVEERRAQCQRLSVLQSLLARQSQLATQSSELITTGGAHGAATNVTEARQKAIQEQSHLLEILQKFESRGEAGFAEQARTRMSTALDVLRSERFDQIRESQADTVAALKALLDSHKSHSSAAIVGGLTLAVLLLWNTFRPPQLKLVPASLVAVLAGTGAAIYFELPVLRVAILDSLVEGIQFMTLRHAPILLDGGLWMNAAVVAVVASAETLLCATAVDQLHTGPRTRYDKELVAQGVGNMLCGLLGALPMTGVIVRSSANLQAGARSRLSSILHGFWLLLFCSQFSGILRLVPTASLAAILVYTGFKLVDLKSVKSLWEYGWTKVAIYLATLVTIVATDLLTGVLIGIGLTIARLLYTFSHLEIRRIEDEQAGKTTLYLIGSATFLRLPQLATALEQVPAGTALHVRFEQLDYIDHACLDLLINWERQHLNTGGQLIIDWDSLTARFYTRQVLPPIAPDPLQSDPGRKF